MTTKRRGREKLHFLNPVPIRLVHDRWVSKYAEPWAAALSGLKRRIEEEAEMDTQTGIDTHGSGKRPWTASPTDRVFEIYIKTTPERLWEAITDDQLRRKYSFGVGVKSDWTPGSSIETFHPGAGAAIGEGELYGGWPMILSGLKTLLETGETLTTPGSLRYSQA